MDLKSALLGWLGQAQNAPGKPVTPAKYPKGKKTIGIATHGKVLKNAKGVLGKIRKTLGVVNRTVAASPLKAYAPVTAARVASAARAVAASPTAAASPASRMAMAHVGAAAPPLNAKAKAAQQKHAAAVAKASAAMKNVTATRNKMLVGAKNLSRAMVAQKKLAVSMRKPKGQAHIGHIMRSMVGQGELSLEERAELDPEFIGQGLPLDPELIGGRVFAPTLIGQGDPNNPPDPNNPGFLMDGSADPNYQGPATTGDPTAGLSDSPLGDQIDNGQVTFPPPPDMSVGFPDMTVVGGVAYDGSRGYPDGFAGSLGLFTRATDRNIAPMTTEIDGNEHHGFVFGQYDWKDRRLGGFGTDSGGANKQPGGGIPWGSSLRSGLWNWVHGRHEMGSEDWHTDVPDPSYIFSSPYDPNANPQYTTAYGQPFGPIVGNPSMADFAHMRCDASGNFFWLPQEAPDWLTFPLKQATALTAKAAADALAAQQAADAAAIAKQQADAAVALAAQQAQQAAAESAAQSASTVQQAQAEGQAAQQIVSQSQADIDAQTAQTQQMQIQNQQEQQAGELLLQMAREQQSVPQGEVTADGGTADGQDQMPMDDGSAGYVDDSMPVDDGSGFAPDGSVMDTGMPDDSGDLTDAEMAEQGM